MAPALKPVPDLSRFFGGRDRKRSTEELLAELIAGQHEIGAEVRGLRADLAKKQDTRSGILFSRTDRARLAKMLPAIGGVFGSEKFSSRDLAEDTSPAVRLVVRGLSVKRISKLFSRAAGVPIDGLMVRNHGKEFQVSQWEIVAC